MATARRCVVHRQGKASRTTTTATKATPARTRGMIQRCDLWLMLLQLHEEMGLRLCSANVFVKKLLLGLINP